MSSMISTVISIPNRIRDFKSRVNLRDFCNRNFELFTPSFSVKANSLNFGLLVISIGYFLTMTYPLFALCRLTLGTLYPAYASYKAVRTKNVREYVSSTSHFYFSTHQEV